MQGTGAEGVGLSAESAGKLMKHAWEGCQLSLEAKMEEAHAVLADDGGCDWTGRRGRDLLVGNDER